MQLLQNCIGPTIRIGQQIQFLPYAGFLEGLANIQTYCLVDSTE